MLLRESRSLGVTAIKIGRSSIVSVSGGSSGSGGGRNSSRSSGDDGCQHPLFSSTGDGDDDDQPLREYMATLGVYFTLPEQGVNSPEILTRLACVAGNTWYVIWYCFGSQHRVLHTGKYLHTWYLVASTPVSFGGNCVMVRMNSITYCTYSSSYEASVGVRPLL